MNNDKAQPDNDATKPFGSRLPVVSAVLALSTAGLYFVGWQYKQSLAMNFGLASYPGDLSFQGTVATGVVAILDGPVITYIAIYMVVVWIILQGLTRIPDLLVSWLNVGRRDKIKATKVIRSIKRRRANNEEIDDRELDKLEKDVEGMYARSRRRRIMINAIGRSLVPLIFATIGSLIIVVLSLFYAGHLVAKSETKAIRTQAMGKCQGCYVYDVKPSALTGIPLFQSSDTIFIQTRSGLARISISKLNGIKPHGRASNTPSKIPRL